VLCASPFAQACYLVGRAYGTGFYVARDPVKADAAIAAYCTLDGDPQGCSEARSLDGKADAKADGSACDAGDLVACERLGQNDYAEDKARTAALTKACAGQVASACAAIAHEAAVTGDATAIATVMTSCKSGVASDCEFLTHYEDIPLATREEAQRQGCTHGSAQLCFAVGAAATDDDARLAAFARACQLDAASGGCYERDQIVASRQPPPTETPYVPPAIDTTVATAAEPTPETTDTAPPATTYTPPRRKRFATSGQLAGGYGALTTSGQPGVSAYFVGAAVRARTVGKAGVTGLLRGSLSYDANKQLGTDAAAGLGIHYALGPLHLQALGLAGRDEVGDDNATDPAILGVPRAMYVGLELGGEVHSGSWGLGVTWEKLVRKDQTDETRFELTVDKRMSSSTIGVGFRNTSFAAPESTSGTTFFGYVGW
jgi:hypothetical protein